MRIVFFILLSISAFAQTPVRRHGALRVESGRIVDQHGVPPQLRGISFSWSVWGGRKYYSPKVVDWLVKDFKTSLVRVSMAIEPKNGYLSDPEGQKKTVLPVIDRAVKKGIYVLIDWHDHHAEKNQEASRLFFAEMAKRYKGVPNVIYEIWNEPDHQSWEVIKAYAEVIIAEIRKHDPDNLIVVGSPRWDQDVDIAAASPIEGYRNIAYSFHFYASDSSHQEKLRAKAEKAMAAGLALFVTEWGVGESNGDGIFDPEKTQTWYDWMEQHRLSWANWNITDKKETTALLQPGAPADGKWKEDELTPAGRYIRTQLRISYRR
ncbi:glycoside hydrolase family 5 protein [Siphonobacter aquaeclarae]|uniref:Endoglucanase n=1 Tax=Siphonobacter aquaeclarae TaxID=563176 RepID=A0A1G9I1V3_9BACT|nr:glycoside hydrolase family 5 protein [Siphonobacter aquaeclarae]SDL18894.1 endoglucanase [Siphonobacter aquaeclarae]